MIKFTIPYPPTKKGKSVFCKRFGLNAYYAGKHWSARKRDAEELHWMTRSAMRRAGIRQRMLQRPVEITFRWDDRLDIDNHAVLGKAIVDGMKGYILQDDSRRYVWRVCHEFWDGGEIQVEVRE